MIHTKEQILATAEKVLKDLEKHFFKKENILGASYVKNEKLIRGNNKGKGAALWTVSIHEPIFDSAVFLTILDETGEPLYIQNKHGIAEIEKDSNGNYK